MELAERVVQIENTILGRLDPPATEREQQLVRAVVVGFLVDAEVGASS